MLHPNNLPAPAPSPLLARAIFELSAVGAPITTLGIICWLTDAGADDEQVYRAVEQFEAAQLSGASA